MIKTDVKRYKQVLFNLLGNAVKFTFQGSIQVEVTYIGKYLITSVKDTGIGIKPDDI
jgi:signal transduction histidine kinase